MSLSSKQSSCLASHTRTATELQTLSCPTLSLLPFKAQIRGRIEATRDAKSNSAARSQVDKTCWSGLMTRAHTTKDRNPHNAASSSHTETTQVLPVNEYKSCGSNIVLIKYCPLRNDKQPGKNHLPRELLQTQIPSIRKQQWPVTAPVFL